MNAPAVEGLGVSDDGAEWLVETFGEILDAIPELTPSEWAERRRYLPPSTTPVPGFYSFSVSPFWKEPLDALGPRSPVRDVSIMKGAQVGYTVGVLENYLGFCIDYEKNLPCLFVTATDEVADRRMETAILPMLEHSGLNEKIRSSEVSNKRKSGRKKGKLDWVGGGYLVTQGAKSPARLRSLPIARLLLDEVDAFGKGVGKDGSPIALAEARTQAYRQQRKILRGSTPLLEGSSEIANSFARGDQRFYFVPCRHCGEYQVLRWTGTHEATGEVWGVVFDVDDDGRLVYGSTRYVCQHCGKAMRNEDKAWMLARGEWRPTATSVSPEVRSYHLSALYAPIGMFSWENAVEQWLEAWDVKRGRTKDFEKLQTFYNNVLGKTFEVKGQRLTMAQVSSYRLREYCYGEIPNRHAEATAGGIIQLLTCSVDVHGSSLRVAVFGWTPRRCSYLIDYFTFEGKAGCTENLEDADTWGKLRELIATKEYVADDGVRYRLPLVLIDCSYLSDQVYQFCGELLDVAYPVRGTEIAQKQWVDGVRLHKVKTGIRGLTVTTDLYKDRLAAALRREWDRMTLQPVGRWNAPADVTDRQLRELTGESKKEKFDKQTGKSLGHVWVRKHNAPNELIDLTVYSYAGLDMLCWAFSPGEEDERVMDWDAFFATTAAGHFMER